MKTLKAVKEEYPNFKGLIEAVYRQLGSMEIVESLMKHGNVADGFNGFIYYSDTCKFARRWRAKIVELLYSEYADCGYSSVEEMVSDFNAFRDKGMDKDELMEFYRFMGGNIKRSDTQIPNMMAWYAAETVARWFED